MNNIKHVSAGWAWLVVAIIGAALAFYWFSVRPEQIRKDCYANPWPSYNGCLLNHGLPAE